MCASRCSTSIFDNCKVSSRAQGKSCALCETQSLIALYNPFPQHDHWNTVLPMGRPLSAVHSIYLCAHLRQRNIRGLNLKFEQSPNRTQCLAFGSRCWAPMLLCNPLWYVSSIRPTASTSTGPQLTTALSSKISRRSTSQAKVVLLWLSSCTQFLASWSWTSTNTAVIGFR